MTRIPSNLFVAAAICFGLAACGAPAETKRNTVESLDEAFELDSIVIESDDGASHEFDVYLAVDHDQQRRGLMFVRGMPQRTGMLFVYEQSGIRSMWMKNTYTSLDLIFARADGSISSVIHDAEPLSLVSRSSIEPVTYVLELNAGAARRYNIGNKSRIVWEAAGK